MFTRRTVKTGTALVIAAAAIAGGPALADGLGATSASPANLSASWEAGKARNAERATTSHSKVL